MRTERQSQQREEPRLCRKRASATLEAAEKLRGTELPILLAWAPGDRFFPIEYALRLAAETGARIVELPDAKTFVPLDQPGRLADEIAAFAAAE